MAKKPDPPGDDTAAPAAAAAPDLTPADATPLPESGGRYVVEGGQLIRVEPATADAPAPEAD